MTVWWGTGETLPGSPSSKDRTYKAGWPKATGAGRESEGFIVPMKAWKHAGGKELCFGHGGNEVRARAWSAGRPTQSPIARKPENSFSHLWMVAKWRMTMRRCVPQSTGRIDTLAGTPRFMRLISCTHHQERPSVSRVREIRMHGLNGGRWRRAA